MPTYQYVCTDCGEQLEAVQKFTDDPLTVCPACEGRLRKQFNSVGIVFKGSGFYRTDSRNGSGGAVSKASDAAKSPAGSTNSSDSATSSESSKTTGAATANGNGSTNGSTAGSTSSKPAKAATA